MSSRRTLILVGAMVIGVIAALLIYNYVQGIDDRANKNAKLVDVFVAKSDIKRGTAGEQAANSKAVEQAQIPQQFKPATAITTTDQLAKKVALFVILLGMIAFAGWRYWRAREAIAAVAEASKDYRKLFPARSREEPPPAPKPLVAAEAPASGMMLKVDDDMRAPRRDPAVVQAPAPDPPQAEAPPAPVVKAAAVAPVKPAQKNFNRRGLNSGGFSRLNGGTGIGFSGGSSSGGGGTAPVTPVLPAVPGVPAVAPAADAN